MSRGSAGACRRHAPWWVCGGQPGASLHAARERFASAPWAPPAADAAATGRSGPRGSGFRRSAGPRACRELPGGRLPGGHEGGSGRNATSLVPQPSHRLPLPPPCAPRSLGRRQRPRRRRRPRVAPQALGGESPPPSAGRLLCPRAALRSLPASRRPLPLPLTSPHLSYAEQARDRLGPVSARGLGPCLLPAGQAALERQLQLAAPLPHRLLRHPWHPQELAPPRQRPPRPPPPPPPREFKCPPASGLRMLVRWVTLTPVWRRCHCSCAHPRSLACPPSLPICSAAAATTGAVATGAASASPT